MKLRIYGLTGKFIRDPDIFALGNFLSAKSRSKIRINSKCELLEVMLVQKI